MLKWINNIQYIQFIKYFNCIKQRYHILKIFKNAIIILLITLLIDHFELPTFILENFPVIGIVCVIFIIIKCLEFGATNLRKLKVINEFDLFAFSLMIALIFYWIAFYGSYHLGLKPIYIWHYRIILSVLIFVTMNFFFIYRMVQLFKKTEILNKNIYSLKDLYENNIKAKEDFILIEEKPVDYDLLKRFKITDDIYYSLTRCKNENTFAIALKGKLGSGKTTIINRVKNKLREDNAKPISNKILIIDDFEPWNYKDEKSLFMGMIEKIIKSLDIKLEIKEMHLFFDTFISDIMKYVKYSKVQKYVYEYFINSNNKFRDEISNHLSNNNQQILFIVDNLERIDKDLITFFFKVITNILNIQNVIYLLSFDDEILKNNLLKENTEIKNDYLKKFIQLEFHIPKVSSELKKDIIGTCLKNLLKLYYIEYNDEDDTEIEKVIDILTNYINNIRDFIIYLNYVSVFFNNRVIYSLNIADMLLLEFIKIHNHDLYNDIWKNKKYFIFETIGNYSKAEEEEFFAKFCKKYASSKMILIGIFPELEAIFEKNTKTREQPSTQLNIRKRLRSQYYFEKYFTNEQEFRSRYSQFKTFLDLFKAKTLNEEHYYYIYPIYLSFINEKYNSSTNKTEFFIEERKYILELIYSYWIIRKWNNSNELLKIIIHFIDNFYPELDSFDIELIYDIIIHIIENQNDVEFNNLKNLLENTYSKLYVLDEIEKRLKNNQKKNEINRIKISMMNRIIDDKIDLSSAISYEKNLHYILKNYKYPEDFKPYFEKVLNTDNVINFLKYIHHYTKKEKIDFHYFQNKIVEKSIIDNLCQNKGKI